MVKRIDHDRIKRAVEAAERTTSGEIVVAIAPWFWGALEPVAERTFERLHVDRTAARNGVLILVCPRRRCCTIRGDIAIHERAGQVLWDTAVAAIAEHAKAGDPTTGIVRAIELVAVELAARFPRAPHDVNELPDAPQRR